MSAFLKISRLVLFALGLSVAAPAQAANLTIPTTHPRLWFGAPGRVSQAQSYFATHSFAAPALDPPPNTSPDDVRLHALHYLMTGTAADCTAPVTWLMDYVPRLLNGDGTPITASDEARWFGEDAMLMYDWCNGFFTPSQKATLIARWNEFIGALNAKSWGGQGMEANNYFWGYLRLGLMWGIASFHDNAQAQSFINHALDVRNDQWFAAWNLRWGMGGVAAEGTQYGNYVIDYPTIAFRSALDFGGTPFASSNFFRDELYNQIYSTLPAPTYLRDTSQTSFERFPFNDDEFFVDGGSAGYQNESADYLQAGIDRGPSTPWAGYARALLQETGLTPEWHVRATASAPGAMGSFSTLPLDYYAPGAGWMYMRSDWSANATVMAFQLGLPFGTGHAHLDIGSFQLWRKGRWLSRETTGYVDNLLGFDNVIKGTDQPEAHNTLLFEGRSELNWESLPPRQPGSDNPDGLPQVIRMQTRPDFSFAAVDLSQAYRARFATQPARYDWPYAEVAIREFFFLRGLRALVIVDRTRASSDSLQPVYTNPDYPLAHLSAAQVRKTFITHFFNAPTLSAGMAVGSYGDQALQLRTLLPASPVYRVVNEKQVPSGDTRIGQSRLEIDSSGSADSYFINVLHPRDGSEANLTASLVDGGTYWDIVLTDPQLGSATVRINKGMTSAGGSVKIGGGVSQPLIDAVQGISITDTGPVWAGSGDAIFANGFE
ncbi:MAG: hypothetical protein ABIW82_15380 [Dokdonella sp.]